MQGWAAVWTKNWTKAYAVPPATQPVHGVSRTCLPGRGLLPSQRLVNQDLLLLLLLLAVLGLCCCARAALQSWRAGFSLLCRLVAEHRLSICGAGAQLLRDTWDLPGPGIEPVSPTLADGCYPLCHQGSPSRDLIQPCLPGCRWSRTWLPRAKVTRPALSELETNSGGDSQAGKGGPEEVRPEQGKATSTPGEPSLPASPGEPSLPASPGAPAPQHLPVALLLLACLGPWKRWLPGGPQTRLPPGWAAAVTP